MASWTQIWFYTSVIPDIQEVENVRIMVQGQPEQNVSEAPSQ
jgi:hypothetical protein